MRPLAGGVAAIVVFSLLGGSVHASCAAPATVAENAGRAVAVVHGTVTEISGGAVVLRVGRVLKGGAGPEIRAFVGPARGGTAIATSVDYAASVGTEHVLYLIRGEDGQLETNACIGSHPGAPGAEELAYFGAGAPPAPVADAESPFSVVAGIGTMLLATIVAVALISWRRRRRPA